MQTKGLFVLIHIKNKDDGSNRQTCLSTPVVLLTVPRRCFFVDPFCYLCFVFVMTLPCSLVVTCWEGLAS